MDSREEDRRGAGVDAQARAPMGGKDGEPAASACDPEVRVGIDYGGLTASQQEQYRKILAISNEKLERVVKKFGNPLDQYGEAVAAYRERVALYREQAEAVGANAVQVGGDHYRSKAVQPWDFIVANGIGFLDGNVIKYVARYRSKNGIEDLKKARHYLDKLIEVEEAKAHDGSA